MDVIKHQVLYLLN